MKLHTVVIGAGQAGLDGFHGPTARIAVEDPAARLACLPMLAANDTGTNLTPRVLRAIGVTVTGRLTVAAGTRGALRGRPRRDHCRG